MFKLMKTTGYFRLRIRLWSGDLWIEYQRKNEDIGHIKGGWL